MAKKDIYMGKQEVQLSREYPFGDVREVDDGMGEKRKVSFLTVNEFNGHDEDKAQKVQSEKYPSMGRIQISISTGITYEESLLLASKDTATVLETLEGF